MIEEFEELIENLIIDKYKFGAYLAKPTGEVLEDDVTYIEVELYGNILYAKPSMPMGANYVPTKEWLEKYKDEIGIWLIFENGNPAHPVWIGTTLLNDVTPDTDNYPNTARFKSELVTLLIDDKDKFIDLDDGQKGKVHLEENLLYLLKENQKLLLEKNCTTLGEENAEKTEAVRSKELINLLTDIMDMVLDMQTISPVGNNSTGRIDPKTLSKYEQIKQQLTTLKSSSVKLD
jgi:hypothetical protein